MRTPLLLLLFAFLLPACSSDGYLDLDDDDTAADDDMADDDAADDDDDVADDDVADDDVAADDDTDPCESGICELTVISAEAGCEWLPDPDPMPPEGILVSSPAPGEVLVMHWDYDWGCCPEISVLGLAYVNDQNVEVEVVLFNDDCDCICVLDVRYTLGDVPSGTWTVFGQPVEVD